MPERAGRRYSAILQCSRKTRQIDHKFSGSFAPLAPYPSKNKHLSAAVKIWNEGDDAICFAHTTWCNLCI